MSQEKKDFYNAIVPFVRMGLATKFDLSVTGVEHLPDQPAIYSANHVKFVDSLFLALAYHGETGIPLRFAAKEEYFQGKGVDDKGKYGRTLKWVMEHGHMLPVDRESGDPRAFQRLQSGVQQRFERGDSVGLHPEGTRSEDGRVHKFKSGAGRIAIALSAPNVPVGIVYTDFSNGRKTHVDVMFGQPILPEEYKKAPYSLLPGRQKAELASQIIENRVADLTGMDQSNVFAKLRKLRNQHPSE